MIIIRDTHYPDYLIQIPFILAEIEVKQLFKPYHTDHKKYSSNSYVITVRDVGSRTEFERIQHLDKEDRQRIKKNNNPISPK
jgi:hypothetical protein